MRSTLPYLGVALAAAALMTNAEAAPEKLVYLNGPGDLAQLRASNPRHYDRAQQVLGAANELCRPQPGDVSFARYEARNISCARMVLRTSNPPKRQIRFTLDDTQYIALVVLTDDPARVVPVR